MGRATSWAFSAIPAIQPRAREAGVVRRPPAPSVTPSAGYRRARRLGRPECGVSCSCRRALDAGGRRVSLVERRPPDAEGRVSAPSAWRATPSAERRTRDAGRVAPDAWRQTRGAGRVTPDARRRTPDAGPEAGRYAVGS